MSSPAMTAWLVSTNSRGVTSAWSASTRIGRAVLVGPAHHEHVVARHPHVPAEDVGGHAEPGDVAEVARAVGVRPGDGGEDLHGA